MNQIKFLTILFFISSTLFSQESIGGRPYSLENENSRSNIAIFETTGINLLASFTFL